MSQETDPFERQLEGSLRRLSDTATPGRPTPDVVAATVDAAHRTGGRAPGFAALLVATSVIALAIVFRPSSSLIGQGATQAPAQTDVATAQGTPVPLAVAYSCGGGRFSPTRLNEPEVDLGTLPAGRALANFIASGTDAESLLPSSGWRVVAAEAKEASFVAPLDGNPPYAHAEAELKDGAWHIVSWGQCRPALDLQGANAATWRLAPGETVSSATTSFLAEVTELACASGISSADRLRPPVIAYDPERVLVIFSVLPLPGDAQECVANPASTVRVELAEPIGARQLLDGGVFPWGDPDPTSGPVQ